ncbi:MOSC domain-containing protein YiiM [Evansella vedderi]|uniref:MOSC domain-containing protein YiiM n=1 Tax=Evansella vedderi TaxID=38282 RepID=A0ABU0A334_9BACI|nr:MOSC domain-containing protein [Evansella vedderi]MDQ0257899.1 MOSC domain-containing protein YiiM [Evansella vedderi]
MTGSLKGIWIKRMKRGPMDFVELASLTENRGIDTNADQGGKRQVTIIEEEVWEQLMNKFNASLDPSNRRANLLVRGIDLKESRGKVLEIGGCKIEILGETKPCERMDEALPGLKDEMYPEWRGGAFGKVLNSGTIKIGDHVNLT